MNLGELLIANIDPEKLEEAIQAMIDAGIVEDDEGDHAVS